MLKTESQAPAHTQQGCQLSFGRWLFWIVGHVLCRNAQRRYAVLLGCKAVQNKHLKSNKQT